MNTSTPIIEARDLTVGYGSYVVQKDLNFTINRQDVFIIMGPRAWRQPWRWRHRGAGP